MVMMMMNNDDDYGGEGDGDGDDDDEDDYGGDVAHCCAIFLCYHNQYPMTDTNTQ